MSGRKRNAISESGGVPSKRNSTMDESVEVVCRITPYSGPDRCLVPVDENTVRCIPPPGSRKDAASGEKVYNFEAVFDEYNCQEDVFKKCGLDLIQKFVSGGNSLLFSYGVTGSGKTYTMTGRPPSEVGILPRSLDVVFNSIENRVSKGVFYPDGRNNYGIRSRWEARAARQILEMERLQISTEVESRVMEQTKVDGYCDDYTCSVFVSYFEIYNNNYFDLLSKDDFQVRKERKDGNDQVYVEGITEVEVENSDEALEVFCRGESKRRTSNTLLNKDSSRSHAIFTVRLVMAPLDTDASGIYPELDASKVVVSQLSLVDLAGSERAKRTQNTGERLAEAANINKSLMVLRQCMEKLRRNQRSRRGNVEQVPYRDSKLTHLFKNFFDGGGKIRMIICANPKPADFEENLNVFSFAEESQAIKVRAAGRLDALDDENRPPVSRRFFARWNAEADEILTWPDYSPPDSRFNFAIKDAYDDGAIKRMREYISDMEEQIEQSRKNVPQLLRSVRHLHCHYDYVVTEFKNLKTEKASVEGQLVDITARLKQSQRENRSKEERLRAYEAENMEMVEKEENKRQNMLEQKEKQRQTEQCLKQIGNVLESIVSPSVAQLRGRFDHPEQEDRDRDRERERKSKRRKPPVPQSSDERRAAAPSSSAWNVNGRTDGKAGGPGFMNPKNRQRRSKSAPRVLGHEPSNRVPTGTVMTPKWPPNSIKVSQPEVHQLQKASDYVLTHQEVDEQGNISTSMYKINIGGSSALIDVNDNTSTSLADHLI